MNDALLFNLWPTLPVTLICIGILIGVLACYGRIKVIYTLVNSNMAVQLKLTAVALRRLAVITKDPEHEKSATEAEALYDEHMAKQAKVDAGK